MTTGRCAKTPRPQRHWVGISVVAMTTLSISACGGGGGGKSSAPKPTPSVAPSSATSSGAASSAAPSGSADNATMVTADETEFTIKLSTTKFTAGTYTFVAKNSGQAPHALEIDGPGVSDRKTTTISGVPQALSP